ncbi:MAG: tripartite tricarboxylate transporter substrate binding protein [Burkholderiaceae bacterium]
MIVGFAAGGAVDVTARVIAPRLGEALGQPVVVENKPGASGNIAADMVAKSAPDGLTLYLSPNTIAVVPSIYRTMSYDPIKDLAPIGQVITTASVLLVSSNSSIRTLADLVGQVRAKPGSVTYSSAGAGSASHLAGNLLSHRIGVPMIHVPYKGSPQAISDMLGGQVDATFAVMSGALPQIQSGKARALAVTSLVRSRYLPDVPTVAEGGFPGYKQLQWYGLFGPANLPASLVERLNRELNRVLARPDVIQQLMTQGLDAAPSTPTELGDLLKKEIPMYAKIVKDAGIPPL